MWRLKLVVPSQKFKQNVSHVHQIVGHDLMRPEDQALLRTLFPGEGTDTEEATPPTAAITSQQAQPANDYWKLKDTITRDITLKEAKALLERNQMPITGSLPTLIDRLVRLLVSKQVEATPRSSFLKLTLLPSFPFAVRSTLLWRRKVWCLWTTRAAVSRGPL